MMTYRTIFGIAALSLACFSLNALAQSTEHVVYFGVGGSERIASTNSSATPASLGYLSHAKTESVWGVDIAGEGVMLDSTWGRTNTATQANSFNFIFGKSYTSDANLRFDFAFLAGLRTETSSCPRSYLGYQCYADTPPSSTHAFNYGFVGGVSFQRAFLGVRFTGESKQVLLGIHF
jgi:hypothetical protein